LVGMARTVLPVGASDVFDYDAELRHYHRRLLEAVDIGPDDRVLDIGCGTGQTTRAAAHAAPGGHAIGVDVSAAMLAHARRLTNLEGVGNARFELGDAQIHPLALEHFTIGLSRFGTMFFADPRAAFANIAGALRPGARFVQLVWQDGGRQAWHTAVQAVLANDAAAPSTPARRAAFSLADPAKVHTVMSGAGFVDVQLAEVREPVYYGADVAGALTAIRSLRMPDDEDDASTDRALRRLEAIADVRDDGVWFDSSAWLVIARRR
jgi:ubiquinone/menaquinone biosynthesis C-methylase UbiE